MNTDFFEKYTCRDINASIHFSKFLNELKQRDIAPAHETKSKLFKEDYMSISIHKSELANCGFWDQIPSFWLLENSQLLRKMW